MIILSASTDNLQVILGEAHSTAPKCYASWRDRTDTSFTPGRTGIATNGANDVNIVAGPSSGQRIIDFFTVTNTDTVNATVTIKLDANGTEFELISQLVLAPKETLIFQEGVGFHVMANSGAIKHSINQGNNVMGSALTAVVLGSDQTNNNGTANTIQDVTGLSFAVTAGLTYYFYFLIQYTAAISSTGSRWSINGPATPTMLSYVSEYTLTSTTTTRNAILQGYDLPAAANASSVVAMNLATIEGLIKPSSNGTVIARFASEVLSSAIIAKAGSVCYYQQLG
jgi:hypothetical protein